MTPLPSGFLDRPFAHRALHGPGRPENALSAVRAAVDAGYGIEIDLQLSADAVPMVFHDDTLDRMTCETGGIHGWKAETLGGIPLLGTEDRIPTLAEALAAVDGRVPLLIELKDQDGALGRNVGVLETAVAEALADYRGPVAVMSFNPYSVAALRDRAPGVPRGLTTCAFQPADWPGLSDTARAELAEMAMLEAVEAAFISHHWQDLGAPRVAEVKAGGLPVLTWTIRSEEEARKARAVADQITFEGFTPA